jgi:hypothetical protein
MTALVYRVDDRHVTVIDEDDGCEAGNHRRDELCARTRLKTLPAWVICPDCNGDEGWMEADEWRECTGCEGAGGWAEPDDGRGGAT